MLMARNTGWSSIKGRIVIYLIEGKLNTQVKQLRQLQLGLMMVGNYSQTERSIYWDGKSETGEAVSSGTYFYQLAAGEYRAIKKMVILKSDYSSQTDSPLKCR